MFSQNFLASHFNFVRDHAADAILGLKNRSDAHVKLGGDLGGGYFPGVQPQLQWSTPAAVGYGLLGVAAAAVGGWLPARMAQRLPPLWDSFLARLPELPGRRAGGPGYGILWQEDAADAELLNYCAAVEVEDADPATLPPGMILVRLGEQLHARFRHVGPVQRLDHTVNYIYSNWLLRSGWRHAGGPDLEIYGDEYQPDSETSVTYYAVPVDPPL